MTHDIAIQLARQALPTESIRNFALVKAFVENQDNRKIWVVAFSLKEEPGVVTSPGTIFVEVDEETEIASVVRDP
jgi:hypothetical protein